MRMQGGGDALRWQGNQDAAASEAHLMSLAWRSCFPQSLAAGRAWQALPLIYWLLRTVPPRPRQIAFPPTRILVGLENKEKTPAKTPMVADC